MLCLFEGSAPLIFPLREGEIDGWGPFVYLRSGPREPSLPIDIDTALKTGGAEVSPLSLSYIMTGFSSLQRTVVWRCLHPLCQATAMHYSEYYKKDPLFLATEEDETPKILQPPPVNRLYNIYGMNTHIHIPPYTRVHQKKEVVKLSFC